MERVLTARHEWPLHNTTGARAVENEALASVEPHTLMRRAGAAVAALARALHPHARNVWIVCGPGNNAGDGLEAALHLQAAGLRVEITMTTDPSGLPSDASNAHARAQAAGISISQKRTLPAAPDIAIDALLGIGSNRAPSALLANWINQLNALHCPVLAVDLPSGLNADTGQPHGEPCVVATHTLALLTLKTGLFTGSGRDLAGDVWLDDLGVAPGTIAPVAYLANALQPRALRMHAQHKGSFGDVAVVGGTTGMVGAALLSARAAHAAGAGRVFVNLLGQNPLAFDAARPELMFRPAWWQADPQTLRQATVVCGCGAGDAVREVLPRILSLAHQLVLDADALNAVASDPVLQQLLTERHTRARESVLTPHPLEAARLLGTSTRVVQDDRLAAAQQLAERYRCVVVLKGSGSVVAAPDTVPHINPTGSAALASAGTGDVLAGWLGGYWSATHTGALTAALRTTWLHGHAADLDGAEPMRAADLVEAMHKASLR